MSIKYGTNKIANSNLNTRVELWRLDKTDDAYGAETSVKVFVKEVFAQAERKKNGITSYPLNCALGKILLIKKATTKPIIGIRKI